MANTIGSNGGSGSGTSTAGGAAPSSSAASGSSASSGPSAATGKTGPSAADDITSSAAQPSAQAQQTTTMSPASTGLQAHAADAHGPSTAEVDHLRALEAQYGTDHHNWPLPTQDDHPTSALRPNLDPGDTAKWAEKHGDAGFLACDTQQRWSVVNRGAPGADGSATYNSTSLDGTPGPSGLSAAQLGQHFNMLQDPSNAAGSTQIRDPQGRVSTFAGLTRGADGSPQINMQGAGGGAAQGMSVAQFAQTYGSSGTTGLIAGATSTPDPAVPGAQWHETTNPDTGTGNLSGTGTVSDTQQNASSNCYWVAAMAAAVQANPQALTNIVRPSANGNPGQYDVTLHTRDASGNLQPHTITVDGRVAADRSGQPISGYTPGGGADGRDGNIAPTLVEKAFTVMQQNVGDGHGRERGGNTGYASTDMGDPGAALEAITGRPATTDASVSPQNPEGLWTAASGASAGRPTIVATTNAGAVAGATLDGGVMSGHAYSVLGSRTDASGNRSIQIHDSAGNGSAATRWIPFETAARVFGTVYTGTS